MAYKGLFYPRNPQKYIGDPNNIIYRSSWEARVMTWLDKNPDIISWASEELTVPYKSPVDGRFHRYFPDFIVKLRTKTGVVKTLMLEIKPKHQTVEPVKKTRATKRYINEVMTWGVNSAKWKAAREYCKDRGYEFIIMTEKNLPIKG